MFDGFGSVWALFSSIFAGPVAFLLGMFVGACVGFAGGKFWGSF